MDFRRVNLRARLWILTRGFNVFALAEYQSVELVGYVHEKISFEHEHLEND